EYEDFMSKPKQLAEKHRVSVPAFAWGKTLHPSGDFTVNREWFDDYLHGFEALAEHGYYPPILQQHEDDGKGKEARAVEDGFIFGKTINVYADDAGIWHEVEVPQAVKDLIDEGYIDEWSPSFREGWKHPHTGEKLKVAPRHLAFVSVPHQKNLPSISQFYSLSEEASLTHGLIHEDTMTTKKKAPAKKRSEEHTTELQSRENI